MPTAIILHEHARVHLVSERIEITSTSADSSGQTLRQIPLRDIERLILSESAQITSAAMAALLRAALPVAFLAWDGRFLGSFQPAAPASGRTRCAQYSRSSDPAFATATARKILTAKLYNQRRVLQRVAAGRQPDPDDPLEQTLRWLDACFTSLKRACDTDELRGHEGASTARYFHAWATFLPPAFPFERRSTRPPLNPVNACISFGATILYSELVTYLHAHGLDPALGVLHANEDGRWSLALDLMEPFRPVLVEALALDLFSHQILNPTHFETRDGGVFLNQDGRRKFFLQYERRMERQFMSEAVGHRTTLRQQLENQATAFKTSLHEPDTFEPFLMN
jgi:CRISPR-associated protein Cas1